MNNLPYGQMGFKLIGNLFFVLILMTGCIHHSSKNETSSESEQIDAPEQVSSEVEKEWNLEFSEDFSDVATGAEPESIFILDGEYKVQKEGGDNKCLLLPGTPMGDFGLLFGNREREKALELSFSFYASKKGRRMPSVAASIGGVRGYKLRLNPAARNIVLSMDETVFKTMPFSWHGDKWWNIRFQALPGNLSQTSRLQFKLWPKEQNEPNEWYLSEDFEIEYRGGKCALWGFPYSSTPILFDDIVILSM